MDFDLVFISSVEPPPSSSSSSSLWHVSSRHWGIEGIAFNAFGLFAWAIPLTISKITESFVFERDRKTKKKASQARGEQSGPQDQSNCIETLAVMTFLRSPNVLTLSPSRLVCTASGVALFWAIGLSGLVVVWRFSFFRGFAKEIPDDATLHT